MTHLTGTSRIPRFTLAAFYFVTCISAVSMTHAQQSESEFTQLFNGTDLSGWHGNDPHRTSQAAAEQRDAAIEAQQAEFKQHWRAENNELVNDGHGPYATTDQSFGDIEFLIDYKTVPFADSGIYLRGTPQVQIWDWTEAGGKWNIKADKGSGGLFNNRAESPGQSPLALADNPFGAWNRFRIIQIGARTWVELNHKLVVDGAIMENYWDNERKTPLPARGPIHLQTHGGEIRWSNIAVREIGSDEAISRLRGDDQKHGFTSVFNGKDLTGWAGAVDDYEVVNGAIACKPGKGGVLFTEQQYDNFVARVEFKLPPGGNNGLAIRYPGTGRAAYDGMCELQILDDDAEKYADLDPRQYHGSVYGLAAAHRGFLRPAGQWNYQEVTVNGSQIKVELNGTVIVDADVSTISEFKDDTPHPGLERTMGHFGFAGHNDPVLFRNIAIKRLAPPTPPPAADEPTTATADALNKQLNDALIFHASFDRTTDAQVFQNDRSIYTAESLSREKSKAGNHVAAVEIAQGEGVSGDALQFKAKTDQVLFYKGSEVGYQEKNWSGSMSLWMKLDPDKDLEPGYCDPIQLTERAWNDAAFFVDFDKELPRDFRLGVFPDLKSWNPNNIDFETIPVDQRPMVPVKSPPFNSDKWTHVCFTWENVNAADGSAGKATLYLNGQPQGSREGPMQFTWDPSKVGLMIGIYYIGLFDELKIFNRALTPEQIVALSGTPQSR